LAISSADSSWWSLWWRASRLVSIWCSCTGWWRNWRHSLCFSS